MRRETAPVRPVRPRPRLFAARQTTGKYGTVWGPRTEGYVSHYTLRSGSAGQRLTSTRDEASQQAIVPRLGVRCMSSSAGAPAPVKPDFTTHRYPEWSVPWLSLIRMLTSAGQVMVGRLQLPSHTTHHGKRQPHFTQQDPLLPRPTYNLRLYLLPISTTNYYLLLPTPHHYHNHYHYHDPTTTTPTTTTTNLHFTTLCYTQDMIRRLNLITGLTRTGSYTPLSTSLVMDWRRRTRLSGVLSSRVLGE
jgi:hypothetical protein